MEGVCAKKTRKSTWTDRRILYGNIAQNIACVTFPSLKTTARYISSVKVSEDKPHTVSLFSVTPSLLCYVLLHDWNDGLRPVWHFQAEIWLVLSPRCMRWIETSNTFLLVFVDFYLYFFGRFLFTWIIWISPEILRMKVDVPKRPLYNTLNIVISQFLFIYFL